MIKSKESSAKPIHSHPISSHDESHTQAQAPTSHHSQNSLFSPWIISLLALAIIVILSNQVLISTVSAQLGNGYFFGSSSQSFTVTGGKDLATVDITSLKSTAHVVAAVFPLEKVQTQDDVIAIMFPSGTPDYGQALGISYDDPVASLSTLASMYNGLKVEVQKNNPQAWQRFINLATKPVGISCEYCCGVGPIGVDKNGNSLCGCQHNPALLSIALYLSAYTDYTDAEILREVMKWKTLFFPKNMVELGLTVAGKDASQLKELPGMVGGC